MKNTIQKEKLHIISKIIFKVIFTWEKQWNTVDG